MCSKNETRKAPSKNIIGLHLVTIIITRNSQIITSTFISEVFQEVCIGNQVFTY